MFLTSIYMNELEAIDKYIEENKSDRLIVMLMQKIKDEFINNYLNENICSHNMYINKGYFNSKMCSCDESLSKYRIIKCTSCGNEICLTKDNNGNWDTLKVRKNYGKCKKMSK